MRQRLPALRTAVSSAAGGRTVSRGGQDRAAQIERIAQVSYDAGERGILELLDAYRRDRRRACARRPRCGRPAGEIELEFVSGWEIP